MSTSAEQRPSSYTRFLAPRFWPTWALLAWMRLAAMLPYPSQIVLGKWFGRLGRHFAGKTRRVVSRNLEICFPERSEAERRELLRAHFGAVGAAFAEMGLGWFASTERLMRLIRIEGIERIDEAVSKGKGIIVLAAHFTCLETGVSILGQLFPNMKTMYRPQPNEMIGMLIVRGRGRFAEEQIPKDNVRAMVRTLRDGGAVVYLADLANRGANTELIPFFGEPAVTTTTVSKLARLTDAVVLTYFFRRLPGREGYVVNIGEPLEGFPTDDVIEDTRRLVQRLEDYIRRAPEQYMWTYRRFKGRPVPYPDVYRPTRS